MIIAMFALVAAQTVAEPAGPELPGIAMTRVVPSDRCPTEGEEIVVCGRRQKRSPYRIPEQSDRFDPNGPVDSVSRERHRLYEVGDTGIHSCSTVGPGGWTGCTFKRWKDMREQHAK